LAPGPVPCIVWMHMTDGNGPTRYGVVDMGSNAIRLQIVEMRGDGNWDVLESHRESVRLGRDVFLTGSIPETAQSATLEVFERFAETCREYAVKHVRAIATSATREAQNGDSLVERIERETGVRVEIISGTEEAYLLKEAVASVVDLDNGRSILVDVGGGSVEVVLVEEGQILSADSYQVGALRLLHAMTHDPEHDSPDSMQLMRHYLGNLDRRLRDRFGSEPIDRYIATGGNIESLAIEMDRRDVRREREGCPAYAMEDLHGEVRSLAILSYAQRIEERGLRPDRADTIVPAGVVYARIGDVALASHVLVPGVGLRDGLLREIAQGHLYAFHASDREDVVLASCRAVGERYRYDEEHANHVARLATQIFDGIAGESGLGSEERILLQAAALLHDVGVLVATPRHHKHTYYLVKECDVVGLTPLEKEIVALVARYHRKALPHTGHEAYAALGRKDRLRVKKLAGILRIADALDRRHAGFVQGLTATMDDRALRLELQTPDDDPDLSLEQWAVDRKVALFQDVFARSVAVT